MREQSARTGMRVDLGAGNWIDVLAPATVNLDDPAAPSAYRVRLGRLAVLLVNRQALDGDPAVLAAGGRCLDALVLPGKSDPVGAAALVHSLRPRLVALPFDGSVTAAALAPLPRGTRLWQVAEGKELEWSAQAGTCQP